MPSPLLSNDKISFIVAKPLLWYDHQYDIGDDFPQEEANNVEVLVRSRYLIPVVDDPADKPKHFHREVQVREVALAKLKRDLVQLVMPTPPDSEEVVNLNQLTDPNREVEEEETEPVPEQQESEPEETPPAVQEQQEQAEAAAEAVHEDQYDPSYHTVVEVNEYLSTATPEERERVLQAEQDGKARKGILEA